MKSLSLSDPHAIVLVGIPSSGKTSFAAKFAETFSAPYLNQAFFEQNAIDSEAAAAMTQAVLFEIVKTKQSVVLELDTATRSSRHELSKALKLHGYSTMFVWVQIDEPTASQRAKKQKMSAGDFAQRMKQFSPPHSTEKALVISGKHTYASQAKVVLKKLSVPRPNASEQRPTQPRGRNSITVR